MMTFLFKAILCYGDSCMMIGRGKISCTLHEGVDYKKEAREREREIKERGETTQWAKRSEGKGRGKGNDK